MNVEIGKTYNLEAINVVAELIDIITYPASGMPPDYIFKLIKGDTIKRFDEYKGHKGHIFVIPDFLMDRLKIKEI